MDLKQERKTMTNKRKRHAKKTLVVGDAPGGNYTEALSRLAGVTSPPGLRHVEIKHDDWCDVFKDKPCNCDPKVVLLTEEDGRAKYE
jgi:hypothetical protein